MHAHRCCLLTFPAVSLECCNVATKTCSFQHRSPSSLTGVCRCCCWCLCVCRCFFLWLLQAHYDAPPEGKDSIVGSGRNSLIRSLFVESESFSNLINRVIDVRDATPAPLHHTPLRTIYVCSICLRHRSPRGSQEALQPQDSRQHNCVEATHSSTVRSLSVSTPLNSLRPPPVPSWMVWCKMLHPRLIPFQTTHATHNRFQW